MNAAPRGGGEAFSLSMQPVAFNPPAPGGLNLPCPGGSCYIGRAFKDYGEFLSRNPGAMPVFMDLVIGRVGGKCLLTIHFVESAFMPGILIPNKCAENVVAVFDGLHGELSPELFGKLFPVILTDRGTEFSKPTRIETARTAHAARTSSSATR